MTYILDTNILVGAYREGFSREFCEWLLLRAREGSIRIPRGGVRGAWTWQGRTRRMVSDTQGHPLPAAGGGLAGDGECHAGI